MAKRGRPSKAEIERRISIAEKAEKEVLKKAEENVKKPAKCPPEHIWVTTPEEFQARHQEAVEKIKKEYTEAFKDVLMRVISARSVMVDARICDADSHEYVVDLLDEIQEIVQDKTT